MYKFNLLLLIILLCTVSCKNNSNTSSKTNESQVISDMEESGKEKLKTLESNNGKMYSRSLNCEAFYNAIDFSSLCFTSDKTPRIQPAPDSGNNCQYKMLLDNYSPEIYVMVSYNDFDNSRYDDAETAKMIFEQAFSRKKKSKLFFTEFTDVDLEDEAYFGKHEGRKQKSLSVRMGNVVIMVQVEQIDKTNPCLLSNDELIKVANLVIAQVKI